MEFFTCLTAVSPPEAPPRGAGSPRLPGRHTHPGQHRGPRTEPPVTVQYTEGGPSAGSCRENRVQEVRLTQVYLKDKGAWGKGTKLLEQLFRRMLHHFFFFTFFFLIVVLFLLFVFLHSLFFVVVLGASSLFLI